MWRAQSGPNCTSNGLALRTLHHKAFDRDALGLKPDRGGYAVMVSNGVAGRTRQRFQRLQNKQVIRPAGNCAGLRFRGMARPRGFSRCRSG